MKLYYLKTSKTGNVYDLKDFYFQDFTAKYDIRYSDDLNFQRNEGSTSIVVPNNIIKDRTIYDFTHIGVLENASKWNVIYEIIQLEYVNAKQSRVYLQEDPLLGNLNELRSKNIIINQSNDTNFFSGNTGVADQSVVHYIKNEREIVEKKQSTTGPWVCFTFQADQDMEEIEFTLKDIDNVPRVDFENYTNRAALVAAYPEITTNNPNSISYFLQFALVNGALFQAIYYNNSIKWSRVNKKYGVDYWKKSYLPAANWELIYQSKKVRFKPVPMVNLGDINTINIIFPLDTSLVYRFNFFPTYEQRGIGWSGTGSLETESLKFPSYYNIESFTQSDKLISVRLIPDELLNTTYQVSEGRQILENRLDYINNSGGTYYYETINHYFTPSFNKEILFPAPDSMAQSTYAPTYDPRQAILSPETMSMPGLQLIQIKNDFKLNKFIDRTKLEEFEPFRSYIMYIYGSMIPISAKYFMQDIYIRITFNSSDTAFEIYTSSEENDFKLLLNIIGSGKLNWLIRWQVDKFDYYEANNPTYKEQFMIDKIGGAVKSLTAGAVIGGVPGLAKAAGGIAISTAFDLINRRNFQKGLELQADLVGGINEVGMTILKGFDMSLLIKYQDYSITYEQLRILKITGFPVAIIKNIDELSPINNNELGKIIVLKGFTYEVVKNMYKTREINKKLEEGVTLIYE